MSPLESGVNSLFFLVLSDGGLEFLSPLESGLNSRFCAVLSGGGIRNSEPFRVLNPQTSFRLFEGIGSSKHLNSLGGFL